MRLEGVAQRAEVCAGADAELEGAAGRQHFRDLGLVAAGELRLRIDAGGDLAAGLFGDQVGEVIGGNSVDAGVAAGGRNAQLKLGIGAVAGGVGRGGRFILLAARGKREYHSKRKNQ